MRKFWFIKLTHLFLWLLAILAVLMLIGQSHREFHTLQVFGTTISGLYVGIGIRVDILSTLLFFMITSLGAAIGHYSIRYLDGEARQSYFFKYLTGIVICSSLLVFSSNFIMLFVMWLAISYNLHKLLLYYSGRPQAVIAARKKAIVSRVGDAALLAAIALTFIAFGSFEFTDIFAKAQVIAHDSAQSPILLVIGLLIVIGALTKSAQFPFHFWLAETMETPTPVSALMHAGVINAGGILVIRMSPLLLHTTAPCILLTFAGTVSAVFGALCMIVQNDIKKKLAYSTMSQLGMMMFACGLGAYSIALFHIFAHSFYKAYAFLSTGKLIEESKKIGFTLKPPSAFFITFVALIGLSAILAGSLYDHGLHLPTTTYCTVILLGFFQNLGRGPFSSQLMAKTIYKITTTLVLATLIYATIEYQFKLELSPMLNNGNNLIYNRDTLTLIAIFTYAVFLGSFILSARLMNINSSFLERVYIYLVNGGYMDIKTTAILGRFGGLPKRSKLEVADAG